MEKFSYALTWPTLGVSRKIIKGSTCTCTLSACTKAQIELFSKQHLNIVNIYEAEEITDNLVGV